MGQPVLCPPAPGPTFLGLCQQELSMIVSVLFDFSLQIFALSAQWYLNNSLFGI
jgi:hypothetical protein